MTESTLELLIKILIAPLLAAVGYLLKEHFGMRQSVAVMDKQVERNERAIANIVDLLQDIRDRGIRIEEELNFLAKKTPPGGYKFGEK